MSQGNDWLNPDAEKNKAEQKQKEKDFARLYLAAFVQNPAGAVLLKQWEETYDRARTPVNATINEYVKAETLRAFFQGIKSQIDLASQP